jgi:alkanesulfonate monooxygenase SsuD/methylene tetrahydromethanopterin reductase-like flavin-dependent oxidoreductase (luciferase family)
MKFGVALPTAYEGLIYPRPFATPESIVRIAIQAEALGFDSVMPNDHFNTQTYVRGLMAGGEPPRYYDPFVSLAAVSAHTRRIRLMTGVIVLPRRGWHRGALVEEGTRAMRVLFEEEHASFEGRFWRFEDVQLTPKPVQRPLPIYIGGNAEANLPRAVRLAQGWLPAVLSAAEIAARVGRLRALAAASEVRLDGFEIAPQLIVSIGRDYEQAVQRFQASHAYRHLVSLQTSTLREQRGGYEQRNLIGSADALLEQVQAYAAAGATELSGLIFAVNTVDEFLEQMAEFAERVIGPHRRQAGS